MSNNNHPLSTVPGYDSSGPGIQIGTKLSATASQEDVQFVKQLGVEWVMTGVNDPEGHLAAAWGVRAVPASFVVDRAGEVRFNEVGYTSELGLRARLWMAD